MRTIPMILMDANAHVGLEHDKLSKTWYPSVSKAVGPNEPEKQNAMGAKVHDFLNQAGLVALNSWFDVSKTYYAQSSKCGDAHRLRLGFAFLF